MMDLHTKAGKRMLAFIILVGTIFLLILINIKTANENERLTHELDTSRQQYETLQTQYMLIQDENWNLHREINK